MSPSRRKARIELGSYRGVFVLENVVAVPYSILSLHFIIELTI